jgi:hypothetical protein
MTRTVPPLRFRLSPAITVAGLVVTIAGLSLATWAPYLLPLLAIPLAVAVYGWRAGTDVDRNGLTVHAGVGARRVPWSQVTELVSDHNQVAARLASGRTLALTAVRPKDLSRITRVANGDEPGQERQEPQVTPTESIIDSASTNDRPEERDSAN